MPTDLSKNKKALFKTISPSISSREISVFVSTQVLEMISGVSVGITILVAIKVGYGVAVPVGAMTFVDTVGWFDIQPVKMLTITMYGKSFFIISTR